MYKLIPLQEIDKDKRAEEIRLIFIDNCLTALLIGNDFETLEYIMEFMPHMFNKYRPIESEKYTIEAIKFLFEKNISIHWSGFLTRMCQTNNLPIVEYLNTILEHVKEHHVLNMFVAIKNRQSRIYSYLYNQYEYNYNINFLVRCSYKTPSDVVKYILQYFIDNNDIDTFRWMQDNKLKFCPNKLLNYAAYINKNNSHHNMCSYFYSMFLVGCPINPNCKYKCWIFGNQAGKWLYDNNLDREHYDENGVIIKAGF